MNDILQSSGFREYTEVTRSVAERAALLADVRSIERWPSRKFEWNRIADFLEAQSIESGIHSFALDSLILDIYIEIVPQAPAYVYFHPNAPRASEFKLPIFSGGNVSEGLRTTRIIPSDPTLLIQPTLELGWHAGAKGIPLQQIYIAIFEKIFSLASPANVVFWGGSGGGFAALFYSYFFSGSTALVWNPQTNLLAYARESVDPYLRFAFGIEDVGKQLPPSDVVFNVSELYRQGYKNKIIILQNDNDWQVETHLFPFLNVLRADARNIVSDSFDGVVTPGVYLYLGRFSEGHEPPSNVEIHCALQEVSAGGGNVEAFNFGALRRSKHTGQLLPRWFTSVVFARRIPGFRPDWPLPTENPALDPAQLGTIKFSTGLSIQAKNDGSVDWAIEFQSNITDNIHELHSLMHIGRLLSLYEEKKDPSILRIALGIVRSFLTHVQNDANLHLVMTNRGYSSADHSMSIRASVLTKLLQVLREVEETWVRDNQLIQDAIAHLWDIGDVITDPAYLYHSNHGIMVCLTGLQVANQFRNLKYLSDQYVRASTRNLVALVRGAFDVDGWANENTVGYHNFVLRLLRDYVDYSRRNSLGDSELGLIEDYIRRGSQALAYCVRQDGSIPPIGDSPLYRAGLPSTNHSKS